MFSCILLACVAPSSRGDDFASSAASPTTNHASTAPADLAPPQITQTPEDVTVAKGRNLALEVTATGEQLTYQWYRGPAGDTSRPVPGGVQALLITPPLYADTSYWARVSNSAGHADTRTISVQARSLATALTLWFTGSNVALNKSVPAATAFTDLGIPAARLSLNDSYARRCFAITAEGDLLGWGKNSYGELGLPTSGSAAVFPPVKVAENVIHATTGQYHTLVLRADGTLWSAGDNSYGQLGDGTTTTRDTFGLIATDVIHASAGMSPSLFVTADGTLWGAGANGGGQLGHLPQGTYPVPVIMDRDVVWAASSMYQSFYLKADGSLWGTAEPYDARVPPGYRYPYVKEHLMDRVVEAAAGRHHLLIRQVDGRVWKLEPSSRLRITQREKPVLVAVGNSPDDPVAALAAGTETSFFLTANHQLYGMGSNFHGQLGLGSAGSQSTPVLLTTGVHSLAATSYDEATFVLRVAPPSGAVLTPEAQVVPVGAAATLSVTVTGDGPFTYAWRRDDVVLSEGEAAGATLTLSPAQLADSGHYTVTVANATGAVTSNTVTLLVHDETHTTYAAWAAAVAGDAGADPLADPGAHGVPLLLRYAFDLADAGGAGALPITLAPAPSEAGDGEHLTLTFTRKTYAADLIYVVEASDDLVNWSTLETLTPGVPAEVTVTDPEPLASTRSRFLRVRVELLTP